MGCGAFKGSRHRYATAVREAQVPVQKVPVQRAPSETNLKLPKYESWKLGNDLDLRDHADVDVTFQSSPVLIPDGFVEAGSSASENQLVAQPSSPTLSPTLSKQTSTRRSAGRQMSFLPSIESEAQLDMSTCEEPSSLSLVSSLHT